jgi:hypothetical protein
MERRLESVSRFGKGGKTIHATITDNFLDASHIVVVPGLASGAVSMVPYIGLSFFL